MTVAVSVAFAASTFAAVLTAAIQLASVVLLLFVCVRSVRGARDARRWRRMAPPVLATEWDRMIRRWVVLAWVSAAMVVVTVALLAHQWGGFAWSACWKC